MKNGHRVVPLVLVGSLLLSASAGSDPQSPFDTDEIKARMIEKLGEQHRRRIETGVDNAASLWRTEDGTGEEFGDFCMAHFVTTPEGRDEALATIEANLEIIRGHTHQVARHLSAPVVLDRGETTPLDRLFARSAPETDFYRSKVAFFIALNFPRYTLEEKLAQGEGWTRKQWATARVGDLFTSRVPREARIEADAHLEGWRDYFRHYFIHMDRVLTPDLEILFPAGTRLNCHHGLRDDIKGQYTKPDGRQRQRLIYRVMRRIIDQSIPRRVIDGKDFFWEPESNRLLQKTDGGFVEFDARPEGGARYGRLLAAFHQQRKLDPHFPGAPDFIARTFEERQIPEADVEALIIAVLESPVIRETAQLIRRRLGRDLEPFDIWYSGFQAQGSWPEDELDRLVRTRYPAPPALQADIPQMLQRLGFPESQARSLAARVVVDPVRAGGHASGPRMRGDHAHLRTVFAANGLDYKAFRIGMHELGHTVHQNLAMYDDGHYILKGLPMSAFAEAIGELFAYRNIRALGLETQTDPDERHMQALASLWYVYEMGGMALTDMRAWRWLYDHPDADVAELQEAVQEIARDIWRAHYAPLFGDDDSPITALYSHMISGRLYLHSYFLGNIIMFQLYEHLEDRDFAAELERMCRLGRLTPSLWMKRAVGSDLSAQPLLRAASEAVAWMN